MDVERKADLWLPSRRLYDLQNRHLCSFNKASSLLGGRSIVPQFVGNCESGTGGAITLSITKYCPPGGLLVLFAEYIGSGTTFSVSGDTRGNSWTKDIGVTTPASLGVWHSVLTTGLQVGDVINVNATGSGPQEHWRAYYIQGPSVPSPTDLATAEFSGSGESFSQTVPARSAAHEIVFCWVVQIPAATVVTEPSGFTWLGNIGTSAGILSWGEVVTAGSFGFALSWNSGSSSYGGVFVSFKL